jgi:hypothetical protein
MLGALLLTASLDGVAQSTVYRCTAPDGRIEFRERPCDGHHQARELHIPDNRTGWVPPKPAPRKEAKGEAKPRRRAATAPEQDRHAERCWEKRQKIQGINNELRAGYTPERGEKLKDRRRAHEAFLNRWCR